MGVKVADHEALIEPPPGCDRAKDVLNVHTRERF